ncbi:MAG: FAD-dependent oxidoreductase [Ruminococcus sp.]|nr:FAD-dependent oxidoreductase [Oscillospiraceae bacterium]MDY4413120.1 FAD-dependent oxidoreductase [Ruminococcus sp.]
MYDVIIVGAGTAGLSSAIYVLRSGKSVLLLEKNYYGGQIINASEIENYPAIKKISGYDFATTLYEQAKNFGADIEYEKVVSVENGLYEKTVITEKNSYKCKSVIIASGLQKRRLGIENEEKFTGRGVSYCAVCDGAFYKGKTVAVAGGGNTALEDALLLSEYCSKVYIIHRRKEFRGEKILAEKLTKRENISYMLNCTITALNGSERLESVSVTSNDSRIPNDIEVSGLFIAIGQVPDNEIFSGLIELDENGYIISKDCSTSADGIFTAGDCRQKDIKQLATAVSDGATAGIKACEYINKKH